VAHGEPADRGGAQARCGGAIGAHRSSAPELSGHGDMGFLGQNGVGVDGVLTWGKMRWGTSSRWLVASALLLRRSVAVYGLSKAASVLKLGMMWQWVLLMLTGYFNCCKRW
jgi:hypothetical protein